MNNSMESLSVGASIDDRVFAGLDTVLVYVDDVRHDLPLAPLFIVYVYCSGARWLRVCIMCDGCACRGCFPLWETGNVGKWASGRVGLRWVYVWSGTTT
jgi:hypothetical protein